MSHQQHIYFDNEGKPIELPSQDSSQVQSNSSKPIMVKYCWFETKKRTTVIAYVRDYTTGNAIYGASIMRNDKRSNSLYTSNDYHRFIATERLYWTPVYVSTSTSVHQSVVEKELLDWVSYYGTRCRTFDYWDDSGYELYERVQYIDIRNPFEKKSTTSKNNQILKVLPYDVSYFWTVTPQRMYVCVYSSNREKSTVKYSYSIFKYDDSKSYLSKSEKIGHIHTALKRFHDKAEHMNIIVANKKELHDCLRNKIESAFKSKNYVKNSLQEIKSNYSDTQESQSGNIRITIDYDKNTRDISFNNDPSLDLEKTKSKDFSLDSFARNSPSPIRSSPRSKQMNNPNKYEQSFDGLRLMLGDIFVKFTEDPDSVSISDISNAHSLVYSLASSSGIPHSTWSEKHKIERNICDLLYCLYLDYIRGTLGQFSGKILEKSKNILKTIFRHLDYSWTKSIDNYHGLTTKCPSPQDKLAPGQDLEFAYNAIKQDPLWIPDYITNNNINPTKSLHKEKKDSKPRRKRNFTNPLPLPLRYKESSPEVEQEETRNYISLRNRKVNRY